MNNDSLKIFSQFPSTKKEIEMTAMTIRNTVLEGEANELLFWKQLMAMDKLVSTMKADVLLKDAVLESAYKYSSKPFEAYNASFRIQETGTKYDYAACGDAEYDEICAEVEKWTAKKKAREEFLKAITPDGEVFGKDGVQIMPPPKTSTTSVVVTIR